METYNLTLNSNADADLVWEQLAAAGLQPLYAIEEGNSTIIAANADFSPESLPNISHIEKITLPEINWVEQWELHGANFHDGLVHIEYPPLKLKPGPGFGDLSHPTTSLILNLLPQYVKDQHVVDVGSGSGILTLAADALGATSSTGIDIEPQAVTHAQENAILNNSNAVFFLPDDLPALPSPTITLMNMVQNEQESAWPHYLSIWQNSSLLITSGILNKKKYLKFMLQNGWTPIHSTTLNKWHAFVFKRK
ncbi:MAG: 50S ribosomal protein L11 methyltransferase [Parachlamydiales bacterium]|jgi:ribosomal protein L11 methyltransferase